jgi:hypothetical protein
VTSLALNQEWFEGEKSAGELVRRFERVKAQSRLRVNLCRFYCSLYHDRSFQGFNDGSNVVEVLIEGMRERLNERVITRIVQGLSAKFARQKPKPTVVTDGAKWALRRRAKLYDKYIWGCFHRVGAYQLQRMSDLFAIITGMGAIYVTSRHGQIYAEAVPSWELFVDTAEARYGGPRTLYRHQLIDRRVLGAIYPKHKRAILDAHATGWDDIYHATGTGDSDMVAVVTGWRLPNGPKSEDGRVVVALASGDDQVVLDTAEWNRPRFPFAFCRYGLVPEGFWGMGIVEQLVGQQLELNRTLTFRQEALRLLSAPFFLVERGSKIIKSHLSNQIGRIIEYTGIKPTVEIPSAINPEQFQHGDRVKSSMFQQAGVSEMAMQAMKPAGLNSAPAQRAYADMLDDGIHDIFVRREQQVVDLAEVILDEMEDLAEQDGADSSVIYVGPNSTEKIDFRKARIDRDEFVLKVQPTSSLSTTLGGRLEDLSDLRELGLVEDKEEMRELLQLTDLEASAARHGVMRETLYKILEVEILENERSITPEPTWDLQLALTMCIESRMRAQLEGAEEGKIELLRIFESQCMAMLNKAAAGQGSPPIAGGEVTTQPPPLPPPGVVPGPEGGASPTAGGEQPVAV